MSLITKRDNIFTKGVIGNARQAQEDSHDKKLDTPNGDVFVVCDGMGGHVGGAKASSLAVESIISYLNKEEYADPITALNGALQFANTQILGYASANPEYKGMGTTACIVLMKQSEVWIAHVGDSRIYLYLGKERQLHRITKDHSYVQTLVDAGQITDEEAEHHPNKNRILKALGIIPQVEPTFNYNAQPICPKNGDVFLICSDGLCGMISDNTIESVLGQNSTLEEKGEMLINLAMEGEIVHPGGQDNCTIELIQIDNSPWEKSSFKSFNPISRKKKRSAKKRFSRKHTIIVLAIAVILLLIAAMVIICQPIRRHNVHKNWDDLKAYENIIIDSIQNKEVKDKINEKYYQKDTIEISRAIKFCEKFIQTAQTKKEPEHCGTLREDSTYLTQKKKEYQQKVDTLKSQNENLIIPIKIKL